MRIVSLSFYHYRIPFVLGTRRGIFVNVKNDVGNATWGDVAPFPNLSSESVNDAFSQLKLKEKELLRIDWTKKNLFSTLGSLNLFPSVHFGLEGALLSLLTPLPSHKVATSALFMGTYEEIIQLAKKRREEGYTFAKVKVSQLALREAELIIDQLKEHFCLRVDVNRAWDTQKALDFFSKYPLDTFDYVEEPFKNPHDLKEFTHPLAIDESFPRDLSLENLTVIKSLKALIYKPTIQGGIHGCLPLIDWAKHQGVELVLSASFESDLGLAHIASMAERLSLKAPIGIGTYHTMQEHLLKTPLQFLHGNVHVPPHLHISSVHDLG